MNVIRAKTNVFQQIKCKSLKDPQRSVGILHRRYSAVPLTSEAYKVKRGKYKVIDSNDVKFFNELLSSRIVTDKNDLEMWNTDWIKNNRGQSKIMLKPKTTNEVSSILKYCNENNIAVCPQGGNTGLVGGSVPVFDEVILSTSLMNNVISVDKTSGILSCQSGCILQNLNDYLEPYKMIVPLDLGAKGSCQIGGNLATNAGGLRLLRYGSLKGNLIGLEVVLADGTILNNLDVVRKNNTGYDLKQLFVGSEGTLGVITGASILCPQKPASVQLSLLGVSSFENMISLLHKAKEDLGEILSAVEFEDDLSMNLVQNNLDLNNPIGNYKFYMLIETSGSNADHDLEKLEKFLDDVLSSGLACDGTVASDLTKMDAIWGLRERLAEALLKDGYCYKYDISLPVPCMYDIVDKMRERLSKLGDSVINVTGYGHLGDGNLHFNVTSKEYNPDVASCIEPYLFHETVKLNGSISAEHGIGFKKRNYLGLNKSDVSIELMRKFKNIMDPNNILNPYKVLPDIE